jgi:hypothetical protein
MALGGLQSQRWKLSVERVTPIRGVKPRKVAMRPSLPFASDFDNLFELYFASAIHMSSF